MGDGVELGVIPVVGFIVLVIGPTGIVVVGAFGVMGVIEVVDDETTAAGAPSIRPPLSLSDYLSSRGRR